MRYRIPRTVRQASYDNVVSPLILASLRTSETGTVQVLLNNLLLAFKLFQPMMRHQWHPSNISSFMAGISGTPKTGSQSIVLSEEYKDVDERDTLVYSDAGGRENKKTGTHVAEVQSSDQTLDKINATLAITGHTLNVVATILPLIDGLL
ncbi:hypothetical protein L211DRAFT_853871 [Terfezia boudieri ATCC MYA-4762]|uniref:YDG domain-containing protein n=1 Tax=Terfezia boudieri ATCC MYA-4762 TaxID=1051890 RepID=A0A3N4L7W9_9PEZI|nr:hypothetical protein L211DRAFT_853871 [Terfezia boudieri ATCC MYA-4762]